MFTVFSFVILNTFAGMTYQADLLLDINSEIYAVKEGQKVVIVLANTLSIDGAPDDGSYRELAAENTIASRYEYVMHGRVFKYEHIKDTQVQVSASFGGLLMRITGSQASLANIVIDQRIYLLMRHEDRRGDIDMSSLPT